MRSVIIKIFIFLCFSSAAFCADYYEILGKHKIEEKTETIEDIEVRDPSYLLTGKIDKNKLSFAGDLSLNAPEFLLSQKEKPDNFIIYNDLYKIARRDKSPLMGQYSTVKNMILLLLVK